jgi:tellurite resistance protein TerC
MVVLNVELADLVFSLDNVVAAVSLSDQLWVVMLGVAIGILMMRFAAGLFAVAVQREPILKKAAYILVLNIGIQLLLEDLAHVEISDWLRFGISIGTLVLCIAYARLKFLHVFNPVLVWLSQGIRHMNGLVDWAIAPVFAILRLFFMLLRLVFGGRKKAPVEA